MQHEGVRVVVRIILLNEDAGRLEELALVLTRVVRDGTAGAVDFILGGRAVGDAGVAVDAPQLGLGKVSAIAHHPRVSGVQSSLLQH